MKNLKDWLDWAEEKQVAIGHFNVSDSEGFKAVTDAARELGVPVIIGVSEKERTCLPECRPHIFDRGRRRSCK